MIMYTRSQVCQKVWNDYIKLLPMNPSLTLSSFCRQNHLVYRYMSKWLERKGLSVKELKKELRGKTCKSGQRVREGGVTSANPTKSAGFLKVVNTEAPEQHMLCDISLTFSSGTVITIKQSAPAAVIEFIKRYEGKEDEPCSL